MRTYEQFEALLEEHLGPPAAASDAGSATPLYGAGEGAPVARGLNQEDPICVD